MAYVNLIFQHVSSVKTSYWCFRIWLLQPDPEEPGYPVLHHEGYRQTRHPKGHGSHSWPSSGKVSSTVLIFIHYLTCWLQMFSNVWFEVNHVFTQTFSPSWTENRDRSTWASTSMHLTRLWLPPQEHQWMEVWPTGRGFTSQRKFITQVQTSTHVVSTASRDGFVLLLVSQKTLRLSFKCFFLHICVSNMNMLMCRSAVSHGLGRSKPRPWGEPWSCGGHRFSSSWRHCIVSGADERRRSRANGWDSLCEERHRETPHLRV